MGWVVDLFNMILSGFQAAVDFFGIEIFELLRQMGEFLYSFLAMAFYDILTLCCTVLSWGFGAVFGGIDFSSGIVSRWGNLTSEARDAAVFFRIPQIMVIYFGALTLRVVRMLIPFF